MPQHSIDLFFFLLFFLLLLFNLLFYMLLYYSFTNLLTEHSNFEHSSYLKIKLSCGPYEQEQRSLPYFTIVYLGACQWTNVAGGKYSQPK